MAEVPDDPHSFEVDPDRRALAVFEVGEHYSSDQIQRSLSVGNAGGIRLSIAENELVRRAVILTSLPTARQLSENPYQDRIENDILVYTGAGRAGEQTLGGVDKRIPQQLDQNFPAYGFMLMGSRRDATIGPKRWLFLGLLEYLRHYPETQMDKAGQMRKAWVFELRIHQEPKRVVVAHDLAIAERVLRDSREINEQTGDDGIIEQPTLVLPAGNTGIAPAQIEEVRAAVLSRPPEQFEHLVKDLMLASGFVDVSVTKYSQDGGIDVNGYAGPRMWPVEKMLVQVQAKRWLHTVGRKEVAELRGSLEPHARGAVVTTSHYSKAAVIEASSPGKSPIVLVDGYSLATLAIAHLGLQLKN